VILRVLRELNKVRTADDQAIAPAYVHQRAWPANTERTTPLRIQKEFASRVGLPILLDINLLKETVKLGVVAGVWLYFDPARQCAYSKESPTSPLVEITDDVELIVPEASEGIPVCGKEKVPGSDKPDEKCPLCGNLTTACACGTPPSPRPGLPAPVGALRAEGLPARAFRGIADLAQDRKVVRLASLEIRAAGEGRELRLDLQAMSLTVPQLPKAEREVEVEATFDLPEGDHLSLRFQGGWDRYRNQIASALGKVAKDAGTEATGHIKLRLTFPVAIEPDGAELRSIREAFDRNNPGHVEVTAHPMPPEGTI